MTPETTVSIHPYFKPHEGKLDEFIIGMTTFINLTEMEEGVLYYEFTVNPDDGVVFCREAYRDGEAALAHLSNVDAQLKAVFGISDLIRLEIHGASSELDKLREPLQDLPVDWFALEARMG